MTRSDGSTIDHIVYTMHGPVGMTVKRVSYTGGPLQNKEAFVYFADQLDNQAHFDTIVSSQFNLGWRPRPKPRFPSI